MNPFALKPFKSGTPSSVEQTQVNHLLRKRAELQSSSSPDSNNDGLKWANTKISCSNNNNGKKSTQNLWWFCCRCWWCAREKSIGKREKWMNKKNFVNSVEKQQHKIEQRKNKKSKRLEKCVCVVYAMNGNQQRWWQKVKHFQARLVRLVGRICCCHRRSSVTQ